MAWVETPKAAPVMYGAKEIITWNAATQLMLGFPISVEVFVDEAGGRIGFRGLYYYGHLRVVFPATYEYGIDATTELAGLDNQLNPGIDGGNEIYIDIPT
jgi:hypothetical protein